MDDGMAFELYDGDDLTGEAAHIIVGFMAVPGEEPLPAHDYPLLKSVWGFKSTFVEHQGVNALREELERLLPQARRLDSAFAGEVTAVIDLLMAAERRRLRVLVAGP